MENLYKIVCDKFILFFGILVALIHCFVIFEIM
jgi:hypothetical protein